MILALLPSLPPFLPTHDDCSTSKDIPVIVSLAPVACIPPSDIQGQEPSKLHRHRSAPTSNSDSSRIDKSPAQPSSTEDLPQYMPPTRKSRSFAKRHLTAHRYIESPQTLPKPSSFPYSPRASSQRPQKLASSRIPLHETHQPEAPEPTDVNRPGHSQTTSASLSLELKKSPEYDTLTTSVPPEPNSNRVEPDHAYSLHDANPSTNFNVLHNYATEFDSSLNAPEQVFLWPGELSDEPVEALLSATPAVVIHPTTEQLTLGANFPALSGEWGGHRFVVQPGQSVLPGLGALTSADPYQDFLGALSAAQVSVSPILPLFSCMAIEEDDLDVEMDEDVIMREDVEADGGIWMDYSIMPDTTMSSPELLDANMLDPPTPPSPMSLEYYPRSTLGDFEFVREAGINGYIWAETALTSNAMDVPTAGFGTSASYAPTMALEPTWTALAQPVDPSRLEVAMLGLVNALANKYAPNKPVQHVQASDLLPTLPTWTSPAPLPPDRLSPENTTDACARPVPAMTLVHAVAPEPVQPTWTIPPMQPADPHQLKATMLGLVRVVANHYASTVMADSFQYVDPRQVDTTSEDPDDLITKTTSGYAVHQPDLHGHTHAFANTCVHDPRTDSSTTDEYTAADEVSTTVATLASAFAEMKAPGTGPTFESGGVHPTMEVPQAGTSGLGDGTQPKFQESDELEYLLDSMRSLRANGVSYDSHTAEPTQLAAGTKVVGSSAPDFVPLGGSDEEEDTENEEEDEGEGEDTKGVELDEQDLASAEDFLARMQAEGLLGP